jgi:hypothetical protein
MPAGSVQALPVRQVKMTYSQIARRLKAIKFRKNGKYERPMDKIVNLVADLYQLDTPRSQVIELLADVWKRNGDFFVSSELSWWKLLTARPIY